MGKAKRSAKPKRIAKPTGLTIRSYQVGFGDCFLLTFHYSARNGKPADKHVLIDCGSTGRPKNAPSLEDVAREIGKDCGEKLTAIIATHRHADHINGFATSTNSKEKSGDILRKLKPDLVMQPWTEDPRVATNALSPIRANGNANAAVTSALFVAGLEGMHTVAEAIQSEVKQIGQHLSASMRAQLSFLGEENLKNLSAVKNLMAMGKAGTAEYLSYGSKTKLEKLLPGVKVHVLGPPTVKQYPEVAKQRSKDASEFWQIMGLSAGRLGSLSLNPFPRADAHPKGHHPPASRWLIGRIRAVHGAQRLGVRSWRQAISISWRCPNRELEFCVKGFQGSSTESDVACRDGFLQGRASRQSQRNSQNPLEYICETRGRWSESPLGDGRVNDGR
jgi:hypothetical protein